MADRTPESPECKQCDIWAPHPAISEPPVAKGASVCMRAEPDGERRSRVHPCVQEGTKGSCAPTSEKEGTSNARRMSSLQSSTLKELVGNLLKSTKKSQRTESSPAEATDKIFVKVLRHK